MAYLDSVLLIVAIVILGAVALHAGFVAFDSLRSSVHRRKQRKRELELWETRLAGARRRQQTQLASQRWAWTGWRKFQVARKEIESPDGSICSFYLRPHDGKPMPGFTPGQFLTFRMPVAGEAKPLVRCYSLSGQPALDGAQDEYRVSIKRVPANPKDPASRPGRCSNHFHDHVQEGDLLDVKPPSGNFVLDLERDSPVVLIGGGVGLTPMMSMLSAIVASGSNREAWFFYGVRNRAEHAMVQQMRQLAAAPNVHLHICYSNPSDGDVAGEHYDHAERVSVDLFKKVLPSSNYDFYMCGPGPMMDSITQGLEDWGVPAANVHLEAFGPSAPKKKPMQANPAAAGPTVSFKKSEKTANWDPGLEHLWEFAKANGVLIDSGCLQGNCGSCETAILKGKVTYAGGPPAFECQDGSCLVCCAQPDGPVELDA
jgi:ferredoxin-NADP reductase